MRPPVAGQQRNRKAERRARERERRDLREREREIAERAFRQAFPRNDDQPPPRID